MIVRNNQPTEPAEQLKVKRRVYEQLLEEHEEMTRQLTKLAEYKATITQAAEYLEKTEIPQAKELAENFRSVLE